MNNDGLTIPKNTLLNWLYRADRNLPLEELGKWINLNTGGRYQLIDSNKPLDNKQNHVESYA